MGHQTGNQAPDHLILTEAHPDSIFWMTQDLRDEEYEEVLVVAEEPLQHKWKAPLYISDMMENSDGCMVISGGSSDRALGVFGFGLWPDEAKGDTPDPAAYIWMIPTKRLMQKHLFALTRQFRKDVLPRLLQDYPSIGSYVMERNTQLIRWMRAAGFKSVRAVTEDGHPFRLMVTRRS